VFGLEKSEGKEAAVDLKVLHAKIEKLTLENELYERLPVKLHFMLLPFRRLGGSKGDLSIGTEVR
jgi:hypothetical protein